MAIGDFVLDVAGLEEAGLLVLDGGPLLDVPFWNDVMEAGPEVWAALRARLGEMLHEGSALRAEVEPCLVPLSDATLHMPFLVAEYTDFYAGRNHAFNVGSMFRSADGAGVSHLHLAGITATPAHPKLAKAALGAQETVAWTYHPNGVAAAESLKAARVELWALERTAGLSEQPSLFSVPVSGAPLAVVVGNEKAGVDPGILALCDAVVSLPMIGRKSSLNAAVAFGIALYYLRYGARAAAREPGG